VYAPAGQEEAQVQQAQELAAGDSYDYGGDQTSSGNDVSNPYLGVASDPTIAAIASGMRNSLNYANPFSPTIMNFADYNALRGTTLADPFRDDPSGIMSAIPFDYRNQRNTYDDLQRQYAQFMNPYGAGRGGDMSILNNMDEESRKALSADLERMDKNPFDSGDKEKGDLRSGLQREYGSIFGSSTGLPTLQGNVVDQDRQFGAGEMFARGLASLAPGPIGTILSQVGKTKPTLDTSPTYDPTKDPNSPEYKGPGYFGNIANVLTGGAGTQISDKVSEEISSLFDGIEFLNKPTNDKDITEIEPTSTYSPNPMGAGENLGEAFNTGIANINPEVTDSAMQMQPEMDIGKTTDNFFNNFYGDIPISKLEASPKVIQELAIEINKKNPEIDFSQAKLRARMEIEKRKANKKIAPTMNPT